MPVGMPPMLFPSDSGCWSWLPPGSGLRITCTWPAEPSSKSSGSLAPIGESESRDVKSLWKVASFLALCLALTPCRAAQIDVLNNDVHFAEGPVWHDGKLYYVEYDRNTVTVWDGKSNRI